MTTDQKPPLEIRTSWWNFFWHWVFCWLLVPPIVAWWRRQQVVLRIFEDRVSIEKGVLNKEVTDFFIDDIRSIEVRQSLIQRMLHIGNLVISTAASAEYEEEIPGVPDPIQLKELILSRRQSRPSRPATE